MLGQVAEIHRFPVKSLAGERLAEVRVELRGVEGDRWWAVREPDGKLGSGKSTRRFRRMDGLLALSARYDGNVPVLTFPGGEVLRADDPAVHAALSDHVGRPVRLAEEGHVSHFDEGPIHLVTTSALRSVEALYGAAVDARHLRPSFVIDTGSESGMVEEGWAGRRVRVGSAVIQVLYAMPRCVMVDMAQVHVPAAHGLLREVTALNGGDLGVVADVLEAGSVREGDPVELI